jgi:hypothetical protein
MKPMASASGDDMAAMNEDLVRSFFQEVDGGRTPVERCSPGFTAYLPGSPPTGLEGLDHFEANIRSAFSNSNTQSRAW